VLGLKKKLDEAEQEIKRLKETIKVTFENVGKVMNDNF